MNRQSAISPEGKPLPARLRLHYPYAYDCASMLVYTCLVYAWGIGVHPQGRDFALFGTGGAGLPTLLRYALMAEHALFGARIWPYHAVNMAMIFLCMVCILFSARFILRGPWWLGTLAAALFMPNLVHSEAVMNLSGIVDLLPCLSALAALWLYLESAEGRSRALPPLAWGAFALAAFAAPANVALLLVFALAEASVVSDERRRYARVLPAACIGAGAAVYHGAALVAHGFRLADMFAPLYFIAYPIGFLPESARRFHEHPWLGWLAAAGVGLVLLLVCLKARRRAILFGLGAMLAVRLFAGERPVDPVHLVGGGQLLLPGAFYALALVAVFHRIMQHPKWRRIVVGGTTFMCIVYFIMGAHTVFAWRESGRRVQAFQETMRRLSADAPGAPIGICPDYRHFAGAPMCLSESVSFDTPWSRRVPHAALLRLDCPKGTEVAIEYAASSRDNAQATVGGAAPLELAPWPYDLSRAGGTQRTETATVTTRIADESGLTLDVTAREGALPARVFVPWTDGLTQESSP